MARAAGSRRYCRRDARYRTTRFPGWRRPTAWLNRRCRSHPHTTRRHSVRAAPPLFALEFSRAFLKERGDTFLEIFRGAGGALRFEFKIKLILERIVGAIPIKLADQRQRDGRAVGEIMGELHGLLRQDRVVIDAVDQSPFQRL